MTIEINREFKALQYEEFFIEELEFFLTEKLRARHQNNAFYIQPSADRDKEADKEKERIIEELSDKLKNLIDTLVEEQAQDIKKAETKRESEDESMDATINIKATPTFWVTRNIDRERFVREQAVEYPFLTHEEVEDPPLQIISIKKKIEDLEYEKSLGELDEEETKAFEYDINKLKDALKYDDYYIQDDDKSVDDYEYLRQGETSIKIDRIGYHFGFKIEISVSVTN